ncbi:MAG TPA: polymer-forming cytoskeletal protein [Steroidobacteraceae bacterium]
MSVFNDQADRVPPAPERRTVPPASQQGTLSRAASHGAAQAPAGAPKVSVLGKTLVFKGELSADEDIILQGRVEGSIHHTQSVTVGIDGVVIGDTHARSIVVEGTVEGDLHGVVSVLIAASATVRGNISAPRVGIMEGANFNGSVDMHSALGAVRGSDATPRTDFGAPSSDTGLTDSSVEKIITK